MNHLSLLAGLVLALTLASSAATRQPAIPSPSVSQLPENLRDLGASLLQATDEGAREELVEDLADADASAVTPFLVALLPHEKHSDVRKAIVDALGESGTGEAIDTLQRLAKSDPDGRVRGLAAKRLAKLTRAAVEPVPPPSAHFEVGTTTAGQVRAAILGDFGTNEGGARDPQEVVATVLAEYARRTPFDLGITVGDNFYPDGIPDRATLAEINLRWQRDWEGPYGKLGIAFYPTLGNHDWRLGAKQQLAYRSASWRMPSARYEFTAGPVHFVAIDTEHLEDLPSQLQWLGETLAASRAPWQVVYGHHPIWSAGEHGDQTETATKLLLPVLKKGGAEVYVAGHDHDMQHLASDGMHSFIVGGGGKDTRKVRPIGGVTRFARRSHGFGIMEATDRNLRVTLVLVELDERRPEERKVTERACTLSFDGSGRLVDDCPWEGK